jgi:hypothetical protein
MATTRDGLIENLQRANDEWKKGKREDKAKKKVEDLVRDAEKLRELLEDEYSRPGKILEYTFEKAKKAIEKFVGVSVENHPFLKFHKEHLKILYDALNVSAATERAKQNLEEARKLVSGLNEFVNENTKPYEKSGKKFKEFRSAQGPILLGAALLRECIIAAPQNPGLGPVINRDAANITKATIDAHDKARNAISDLFILYVALEQKLGLVRALEVKAEKEYSRISKERTPLRNEGSIAESRIDTEWQLQEVMKEVTDEGWAELDIRTGDLSKVVQKEIEYVQQLMEMWAQEDDRFSNELLAQTVFSAELLQLK